MSKQRIATFQLIIHCQTYFEGLYKNYLGCLNKIPLFYEKNGTSFEIQNNLNIINEQWNVY